MFAFKPDYEATRQRIDAFWARELIDRPVIQFTLNKTEGLVPYPEEQHANPAERWMDAQYQAEWTLASFSNQEFLGDSLPVAYPNLGPEILAALYGCPLHFGDYGTSWSDPILHDWADADAIHLDWNSPYLVKLHEMFDALLEIGKGKFLVGATDYHPGGDLLAAFRDPQNLAIDILDHKEAVITLLNRLEPDYFKVFDIFYEKLCAAGLPCTTWVNLVCDGRYYVPSNDFSIMISTRQFEEIFLPGIIRECQFLDHSIYHLDGPSALRHLDLLLSIPELDALQFVPGAGNEDYSRWINVYQKAQAAGKGIEVLCSVEEIPLIMETLDPHGVYLNVNNIDSRDTAESILKRLEKWAVRRI